MKRKSRKAKKLTLNKETISQLTSDQTHLIGGGINSDLVCTFQTDCGCPSDGGNTNCNCGTLGGLCITSYNLCQPFVKNKK